MIMGLIFPQDAEILCSPMAIGHFANLHGTGTECVSPLTRAFISLLSESFSTIVFFFMNFVSGDLAPGPEIVLTLNMNIQLPMFCRDISTCGHKYTWLIGSDNSNGIASEL